MSNYINKNHINGFTITELVIVVVIIGILAAVILPKFIDVTDKAQLAQAHGVAAGLRSGVNMVQATFISQRHTSRVQNLPNFGDGTIDTNNIGFPIGINKGNGNENIGNGNAGCVGLWEGLLTNPPTVAHNNNSQDYRSYRHTNSKVCSYVYRASGDMGNQNTGELVIKYDSRDGSVTICGTRPDLPDC